MPEITGIDHIYIAVSDFAVSEAFYDKAMPALGFRKSVFELGGDRHIQYFNRHFGFVIRPAKGGSHDPYGPGLHHLCFRFDSADDVADARARLVAAGVAASQPRLYPEYAPDYCAIFFADPDGVRLEITNYRQERRERHENWDG